MNKSGKPMAVIMALLAATFYAINTPFSKVLLEKVTPTFMASFLYLGAGIGVGIMYRFDDWDKCRFSIKCIITWKL